MSCASWPLISHFEVLEPRESAGGLTAVNRGRPTPENWQQGLCGGHTGGLVPGSETAAIKFSPFFLSKTVTSQTCVGRGGEREAKVGDGNKELALGC